MIVALLYAWCTLPIMLPPFHLGALTIGVTDILGPVTLAYCLIQSIIRRSKITKIQVLFSIYLLFSFISVLALSESNIMPTAFLRALRMLFIISPIFLLFYAENSEKLCYQLVRISIYASTIGIGSALVAYFLGFEAAVAVQTIDFGQGELVGRAGGWVGDSSAFGHQIGTAASLLILVYLARLAEVRFSKIFLVLAFSVILIGLYASSSRSALVNVIGSIAAFFLLPGEKLKYRLKILSRVLVAVIFAVLFFYALGQTGIIDNTDFLTERMFGGFENKSDINSLSAGRIDNWNWMYHIFLSNWLTGIGYSALFSAFDVPADNLYIKAFVETGFFGGMSLILAALCTLVALGKKSRGIKIAKIALCLFIGQLINAFFVDIFTFYSSMPMVLLICISAATIRKTPKNQPSQSSYRLRIGK